MSNEYAKEQAARNREYLGDVIKRLNQIPKDILFDAAEAAFTTAVENTHQDSGNAAWHWTITGLRAQERVDPRLEFSIKYGHTPIGYRDDAGTNEDAVNTATIDHGLSVLQRMVYQDGRKAVSIVNNINPDNYASNAKVRNSMDVTRDALAAARLAAAKAGEIKNRGY